MKSMTCKALGGACGQVFTANTFEEISLLSRNHGMEMFKKSDVPHLEAMDKMKVLMETPDAMQEWMKNKKHEFEIK